MNVTKKTYEAPEMEVVEIEQADIIATSTPGVFTLDNNGQLGSGDSSVWN